MTAKDLAELVQTLYRLLGQANSVMRPTGEFLTVDEAAAELRCSRDTVTRLIESGRLPAKNLGQGRHANYRVRRCDLSALDVAHSTKAPRVPRRRASSPYRRLA